MPEVGDTARIRNISGRSIASELPNVDDQDELQDAAKLVYSRMSSILDNAKPTPKSYHLYHIKGRLWDGRMRMEIIYALWPRMADPVLVATDERDRICKAIYEYLRLTKTVVCIQRTGKVLPAVWWVGDHWTPITTSHVSPEPEAVVQEQEPVIEEPSASVLPCRVCNDSFTDPRGRSGHEYRQHKVVATTDGTVYSYVDPGFTKAYIAKEILEALWGAEAPCTLTGLTRLTSAKDPRLGVPAVRVVLDSLVEKGLVVSAQRASLTYYDAVAEDVTEEELDTMMEEATPVEVVTRKPESPDFASLIASAQHLTATTQGNFRALGESFEGIAAYVAGLQREIASLKTRLMAAPKATEDVEALKAELAKAVKERDEWKAKVEDFQRALGVLVK